MRRAFVDTSAFVALRNRGEREHRAARQALRALVDARVVLFTSTYVFSETYTALLVRVGRREALEWGRALRSGRAIEVVPLDDELLDDAWALLETHGDKGWSHVDATSFALIERDRADAAFAFDQHFLQRGLRVVPAHGLPDRTSPDTR